jgi:hypothetical protein
MSIPSDSISTGRNPDLGTWKDNRYVRCQRCGFMCHLDRDSRASEGSRVGEGMSYSTTFNTVSLTGNAAYSSATVSVVRNDPIVIGGCPQCGTYMYDKQGEV